VVRREREIAGFKAAAYFTVKADFQHANGMVTAYWRPREDQFGLDAERALTDHGIAQTLLETLGGAAEKALIALCETTEKQELQRLPLSLSALQVMAGKKFNYDPQTVLDTAQKLYERKLTSYPRSDCDFLPEAQHSDAAVILENLRGIKQDELAAWSFQADPQLQSRAWNDKKLRPSCHYSNAGALQFCRFERY